ncbi:hypothetical protein LEP1GSC168_0408 [Leptospira santarosai str. HAI134]|uniref:Uncharacterized protein n=1 Tax=Leptospira santarosai str. MOR084 TaxID=1049984 RepID=A0A0E2BM63_9LEPT|nr:hypothetical protein LEP1GSC179_0842 [Leptospira santarosai str. MOR084]EKR92389.1 hypothetical protein LEP1GSC163_1408 [Leptospira santarosai str. CBC379]EMO20966.1 hypothetical protein LEP1GSC168_0408 [Leptospira santarosai str. HAI134]EMP80445.1 hypothetical protein LEP1GSC162_0331 [Leptospira santarosai str. CBC1531]
MFLKCEEFYRRSGELKYSSILNLRSFLKSYLKNTLSLLKISIPVILRYF